MAWPKEFYGSRRWQKLSRFNLQQHPMCAECRRAGRTREATLSHHVNEHRDGDDVLKFWFGELESLCFSCHLRVHHKPAMRGYRADIGDDGWPIDPRHYANSGRIST